MQDLLTSAAELHHQGRLDRAAQLYQQALAQDGENVEVIHRLGVLYHQQGNYRQAIEMIGRAVALRPNSAAFHANLAESFRASGDFERAIGCCRTALRLEPDYPEALCNLGAALQGLNRHAEAAEQFRETLKLRPDFCVAHNNLGVALRELGQTDEALVHFRRAVETEPAFAPAQTNLGQLLSARGLADEALAHCQEAVRLQPNSAAMHHNLGNVLRELGRWVDARAAYLEALRISPDLAVAHAHLGLVLQKQSELASALPWLKRAVELEPRDASFWQFLAELHADLEEQEQAIPCWQKVVALTPDAVFARLSLGWALQEEGRLSEAGEQYQAALSTSSNWPSTWIHLGGMHEELGALPEAEAAFRKAIELQPSSAIAQSRLATLLRGKLPPADLAAIEERLKDDKLEQGPRARLLYGLAHVLDGLDQFDRAGECSRQANALVAAITPSHRKFAASEHDRFIGTMQATFTAELFSRLKACGSDSARPVFIFGLPRSGTTLVEQILASHAEVHAAGELRYGRQSFEALSSVVNRNVGYFEAIAHLDLSAVSRLAELHLQKLHLLDGGRAERIVDKMPENYMFLGLLAILFPNATFLHCRRDLRDVAVSCWMTDFRGIRWAHDPQDMRNRFLQYRRLMSHWSEVCPAPIHHVDYEQLVSNLEPMAKNLVEACGLDWQPSCLEFYQTKRPIRTASVTQVRQPVYQRSVGRWKKYQTSLADLIAAASVDGGN
jgi:tetratricopeptide (TPR) repeat protein